MKIQTTGDGTVAFLAPLHMTRLTARDIFRLEGLYGGEYDGDVIWRLQVDHPEGRFRLRELENARGVVDRVKTHNPDMEIAGL